MKTPIGFQVLSLAAMLSAVTASASVQVYGEAASTGPNISVQVYADIGGPAVVSHTFKLFYNASQLQVLSATRNDAQWYLHDGSRSVPYPNPDTSHVGEVLFVGAHMDARTPGAGVSGNHVPLGTVRFARTGQATPAFNLTIGRAGQFASFVTTTGMILDAQPGQVLMQGVAPNGDDQDLDGLMDKWEETFFGSTRGVFYSDDPDKDGVNNLGEQAIGSDPNDPNSNLRLTVSERDGRVLLEWASTEGRRYILEAGKELGKFEPLKDGIKATPPMNSMEFDRQDLGEANFFRLRLETPATP